MTLYPGPVSRTFQAPQGRSCRWPMWSCSRCSCSFFCFSIVLHVASGSWFTVHSSRFTIGGPKPNVQRPKSLDVHSSQFMVHGSWHVQCRISEFEFRICRQSFRISEFGFRIYSGLHNSQFEIANSKFKSHSLMIFWRPRRTFRVAFRVSITMWACCTSHP